MIRHLLKLVWHRKRTNALLIVEILASFLVVFVVVTMAMSLLLRWNEPLGFDYHDVWRIAMSSKDLPPNADDDPNRPAREQLLREVRAFRQVIDVALSDTPAYGNGTWDSSQTINGRTVEMTCDNVTDGFANVMRLKLLRGRWFSTADDALAYTPAVIDADLAQQMYGDADPIGQKVYSSSADATERVVGVIAPFRKDGEITPTARNMIFFRKTLAKPNGVVPRSMLLRIRPGTSPDFEQTLIQRLHAVSPDTALQVHHMERMRDTFLRLRLAPVLVLGLVCLFLIAMVALGLTGVLWQTVTRRTREIGLRRALGANGSNVRAQILGEVALLTTLALIAGCVIVLQLPLLGAFGLVHPRVFTLGVVVALAAIYAITLLCGAYPSWLASRVEPAEALRYE
jgi:putative ABC transport system permease protein